MKLSHVNSFLLICILLVNGYIIVAPVLPQLIFAVDNQGGQRQLLTNKIHANTTMSVSPKGDTAQGNQLIIPSMLLDGKIYEGPLSQQYQTLNKGIWHYATSSTPDKGGNTVLLGHRFTYSNPRGILYFLNKVNIGDEIGVMWQNSRYHYTVTEVKVVPPTDLSVQAATGDSRLTIYTCAPLWLPKDRLVVIAELEKP